MIFNPILGGREGFLDDSDARPLTIGGFATAFYSGLWAYDGWNNLVNKVLIMWGSIIVKAMQHFFKNGPTRPLFLFTVGLFKQTSLQFFTTIICEKMSLGAGIRTHDLRNVSLFP